MKKATAEILSEGISQSFLCRKFGRKGFEAPYHFHDEIELTFIVKGTGKRFAGTHQDVFDSGDFILLGSQLPHCWMLDDTPDNAHAASIVIQFRENFLGNNFFLKPEFSRIGDLLFQSRKGISFSKDIASELLPEILQLAEESDSFNKLMRLLNILNRLAAIEEFNFLNEGEIQFSRTSDQERINRVFAFIVENFRNEISLKDVADVANMSTHAFCKYFKKITRKTLVETIVNYRIDYAVKLLLNTSRPIGDVGLESGFGDMSHFYKVFKSRYGISPLKYRHKYKTMLEHS